MVESILGGGVGWLVVPIVVSWVMSGRTRGSPFI